MYQLSHFSLGTADKFILGSQSSDTKTKKFIFLPFGCAECQVMEQCVFMQTFRIP